VTHRLSFRARRGTEAEPVPGDAPLGLEPLRDGVLYVPDNAEPGGPVMVLFHGAGGTGRRELRAVVAAADRYGVVVVAPDSRAVTWDVIVLGGFAGDVAFVDRALDEAVSRCGADFTRMAASGISDGASYALSLGLANGDFFEVVLAFSPGFVHPAQHVGMPRVFISHGVSDPVLPIDVCGRPIAAGLRSAGYDVTFREFDGGHTVPPVVADEAVRWWLGAADKAHAGGGRT
jgi:phospholipase/carboxylesterase